MDRCRMSLVVLFVIASQCSGDTKYDKITISSSVEFQGTTKYHAKSWIKDLINQEPPEETQNVEGTIESDELIMAVKNDQNIDKQSTTESVHKRKTVEFGYMLWPNAIVPWKYSEDKDKKFKNSDTKVKIHDAMEHWEKRTCLRFIPLWLYPQAFKPSHYLEIQKGPGCASAVGYQQYYAQPLVLNEMHCLGLGTIVHEIGHTIGFYHEHARRDREKFIRINSDNILDDMQSNFQEAVYSTTETLYDLGSDMHYGPKYFSGNGENTIDAIDPDLAFLMGRRDGLSFLDTKAANIAYNCADKCSPDIKCENKGFVTQNCSCYCPYGLSGERCQFISQGFSSECSQKFDLTFGEKIVINSPKYSRRNSQSECFWLVKAEAGNSLKMKLTLNLPSDTKNHICIHWLEVRYSHVGQEGPRYCGYTSIPVNITSNTDIITITMNTTTSVGYRHTGFNMVIQAEGPIDRMVQCTFVKSEKCPFYFEETSDLVWKIIDQIPSLRTNRSDDKTDVRYVVASSPVSSTSATQTGLLTSADIKAGNWCLCFEYYSPLGDLSVVLQSSDVSSPSKTLWEDKLNPDTLRSVCVNVNQTTKFKLSISVNLKEYNLVVLSKITLEPNGICVNDVSASDQSTSNNDLVLWKCDFESDMCGLHDCYGYYTMKWERMPKYPLFGPNHGHRKSEDDYGSNFFLVRNGMYKRRGSEACTVSKDVLLKNNENCLEFYFYVWGFSTGNVSINIVDENGDKTLIWSFDKYGLQNIRWKLYEIPITVTGNMKLSFETVLKFWWGSFGIDDIKVKETDC